MVGEIIAGSGRAEDVAYIEHRVRPGRLGQVLDGDADARVAFEEQDIARLERGRELFQRGGCGLSTADRLRQVGG